MRQQLSVRRTFRWVWRGWELACGFGLAGQERAELCDRAHQWGGEDDGGVLVDRDLDEALEAAAGSEKAGYTLAYCSGLSVCPA
jgi:hypothetical protein